MKKNQITFIECPMSYLVYSKTLTVESLVQRYKGQLTYFQQNPIDLFSYNCIQIWDEFDNTTLIHVLLIVTEIRVLPLEVWHK
jgi:hypothetical protein